MGIVRGDRRTTTNANEMTRGSRLVLMSSISANGFALKAVMMWGKKSGDEGREGCEET
jgi:hypothetical protein